MSASEFFCCVTVPEKDGAVIVKGLLFSLTWETGNYKLLEIPDIMR